MSFELISVIKWGLLAALASLMISANNKNLLGSLSQNPSPIYTPDYYPNGTFLQLPLGTMRYWLFGNPEGERVVLVHGISIPSPIYTKLAQELADQGHHVLVYDLWGRGYSDAPATDYNEALYTNQLANLLQKVGWDKANIVGLSLGGGIVTSFTSYYPEMVKRLVLLAPAGLMEPEDVPLYGKIARLPIVRNIIIHPYFRPVALAAVEKFTRDARTSSTTSGQASDISVTVGNIAVYQFSNHPGFFRAFLGSVVDYPLAGLNERYAKVGTQSERPVLLVWGDKDITVYYSNAKTLVSLVPHAKLITLEGKAHDIVLTDWKRIATDVVDFIANTKPYIQ
ncbi:alpha/beta-hydrolase [Backusella circina FSU 941]|nr:alpha/beta-hydrolase [Backusella circina FSU 941]